MILVVFINQNYLTNLNLGYYYYHHHHFKNSFNIKGFTRAFNFKLFK
jgi:hypothetical protein